MTNNNQNKLTLLDSLITDILDDLTLDGQVSIANLNENELRTLQLVTGKYMKFRIEQLSEHGNDELLKECREKSGDKSLDDADASIFILKEIWNRLQETHRLRIVK